MKKKVVTLFLAWVMLIGGIIPANAQTINVTGTTATGTTPTSFTITASMLEGGELVVTVPTQMTLGYDEASSQFTKSDVVNVKGNIDPSKRVDITTPTDITYVHADDNSITAAGTVAFGAVDNLNQKTSWTAKELHDDIYSGGGNDGVDKPIVSTVPKSNVQYIGEYNASILFNIEVVDNLNYETLSRANINDWVTYNSDTNVATIKASRVGADSKTYYLNEISSDAFGKGAEGLGSVYNASLTGVVFEDNSKVKTIKAGAFAGCTSLTSINIPASVEVIEDGAFEDCSRLTTVTGLSGVKTIGENAFSGTTASITLPNTVTKLGYGAFSRITSINFAGTIAQWDAVENLGALDNGATVRCSDGILTYEDVADTSSEFVSTSGTVVTINAASGNKRVSSIYKDGSGFVVPNDTTELVIANGVSVINEAFTGGAALTSIKIPADCLILDASSDNSFLGSITNVARINTFNFNGTKAQFNEFLLKNDYTKSNGMNFLVNGTNVTEITCTDGPVSI